MDVRAIILAGAAGEQASAFSTPAEQVAGVPLALLDVLGASILQRTVERLRAFGAAGIAVISEPAGPLVSTPLAADVRPQVAAGAAFWRAAESAFQDQARAGAELLFVLRLGPYLELDLDDLLQFHLDRRARVTAVLDRQGGPLDAFVISGSRRNDAAYLFRNQLRRQRTQAAEYRFRGYANPLRDPADLRRLALDAFFGQAQLRPVGRELRPGIWVGEGARIQRGARIVAPAYIGRRARVRPAAVVTRGSSLEHHAEVDCGTVVENATALPYSYLGAGLDVANAVVGFKRLFHLQRQVEVEVGDPKLLAMASPRAPLRALSNAAGLAGFLPRQILRGIFVRPQPAEAPALPQSLNAPAAELPTAPNLVVARRYGND